jgi:hypothetical protein
MLYEMTKYCKVVLIIGSQVKNVDCSSLPLGVLDGTTWFNSLSRSLVSSGRQVSLKTS